MFDQEIQAISQHGLCWLNIPRHSKFDKYNTAHPQKKRGYTQSKLDLKTVYTEDQITLPEIPAGANYLGVCGFQVYGSSRNIYTVDPNTVDLSKINHEFETKRQVCSLLNQCGENLKSMDIAFITRQDHVGRFEQITTKFFTP